MSALYVHTTDNPGLNLGRKWLNEGNNIKIIQDNNQATIATFDFINGNNIEIIPDNNNKTITISQKYALVERIFDFMPRRATAYESSTTNTTYTDVFNYDGANRLYFKKLFSDNEEIKAIKIFGMCRLKTVSGGTAYARLKFVANGIATLYSNEYQTNDTSYQDAYSEDIKFSIELTQTQIQNIKNGNTYALFQIMNSAGLTTTIEVGRIYMVVVVKYPLIQL